MKHLMLTIALVLFSTVAAGEEQLAVGARLQTLCVTIRAADAGGSGTIVVRPVEGKQVAWVLTAAHVITGLRSVQDVISSDGSLKKQVTYRDAEIRQEYRQDGATVGGEHWLAKVVNIDPRRDLALLRVRVTGKYADSIVFYAGDQIPQPGTRVYHCASPAGEAASLTSGIIAQVGRRIDQFGGAEAIYDQLTCPALPGSSGGMVTLESSGELIGVLTLGLQGTDTFHYCVPVRRIKEWATEIKCTWLLDPKEKTPSEEEIGKITLELAPPGFSGKQHATAKPELARPAIYQ